MKTEREFVDVAAGEWQPGAAPLMSVLVLNQDADDPDLRTQLTRWDPGYASGGSEPISHDYVEEILILEGSLSDLRLGQTFSGGYYAYRPPGMPHGPYVSEAGVLMLEIRSRG